MPQIKIRGLQKEKVISASKKIIDELVQVVQCPREDFTIECINSTYIMDGKIIEPYPFIEIAWFDRGQEIQDKVAIIITNNLLAQGIESIDLIFTVLEGRKYYVNGKHF